jgi:hypothetical protein
MEAGSLSRDLEISNVWTAIKENQRRYFGEAIAIL